MFGLISEIYLVAGGCESEAPERGEDREFEVGSLSRSCQRKVGEAKSWVKQLVPDPSSIADSLKDRFGDLIGRRRRKRDVLDSVCSSLDLGSLCAGVIQGDAICKPLKMGPVSGELDVANGSLKIFNGTLF